MWEYINSFWETGKDATEYVYSATGEVYDSVTGEVVGYYDETTAAIYDSAGNLVEYVSDTAGGLYDDMRGGLTRVGDLASEGFDAVGRVGAKALVGRCRLACPANPGIGHSGRCRSLGFCRLPGAA